MEQWLRKALITVLSIVLCLYTIVFINYNLLQPQSALAIFIMLGMVLSFLSMPAFAWIRSPADSFDTGTGRSTAIWYTDLVLRWLLAALTVLCFGYIVIQTEPPFSFLWPDSGPFTRPTSLGDRAGSETSLDYLVAVIGVLLVLESTRRSIGWIVPALAIAFILHAYFAPELPDWMLPHQGKTPKQVTCSTFLQSLGVLGPAAGVMFRYVFLFVVFGAFLEMSGATQFIIDFSEKLFGRSSGGPAKVAVIGSGMMGSLSGSAVANAVTTGSFTIPVMRSSGFTARDAGGITAAAATGGALVPPVMGAGAYMMLEFVERAPGEPQVTFLEIAKAAVIPALLYYFSLFMIVHFYARRAEKEKGQLISEAGLDETKRKISVFEGLVFFGALGVLVGLLVAGFSPFRAVTGSLVLILALAPLRKQLQMSIAPRTLAIGTFLAVVALHQWTRYWSDDPGLPVWLRQFMATSWLDPVSGEPEAREIFDSVFGSTIIGMLVLLLFGMIHPVWRPQVVSAFKRAAANGIALVAASACVGIIIGVVQTTPIANDFGEAIKSVVESSLLLALIGIMVCSIVLGMGVPSVVCYLLMATLMGSLLGELGVDPLAAHLFIFYFGMMSMVTPPVALAAYASASIAQAPIMQTAFAAFRFSLVGFTLPFMFIYRPSLLLMAPLGGEFSWWMVAIAVVASTLGVIALAAGLTGFLRRHLSWPTRLLLIVAAALLLAPNVGGRQIGIAINIVGGLLLLAVVATNVVGRSRLTPGGGHGGESA